MVDFACKQLDIEQVIKCSLGLTRAEFAIFRFFLKHTLDDFVTHDLAKRLKLNLTTIQKGVKKLHEKDIIIRHQKNLEKGGYLYTYQCNSTAKIRQIIKGTIRDWGKRVESAVDHWG